MPPEKFDVVIVGAGFAGAATAFHLSEQFQGSMLVIEREEVPGVHASGRNASLILQTVTDPVVRLATARSRREFTRLHAELGFQDLRRFLVKLAFALFQLLLQLLDLGRVVLEHLAALLSLGALRLDLAAERPVQRLTRFHAGPFLPPGSCSR